jgi:hypothetical protein
MLRKSLLNMVDEFIVYMQFRKINSPVNSKEIETHFGLSGSEIRDVIRHLRRKGYPIANTKISEGLTTKIYFWASSWDEMKPTIYELENRRNDLSETISSLRKKFNQYDEPTLL